MNYIRPIDWSAGTRRESGSVGLFLYAGESCYIIATKAPSGTHGPLRHTHPSDQIYVVVEGETTLELGAEEYVIGKNGIGFIPAGTPHCSRNDGDGEEMHIEILAPGGIVREPIVTYTDSRDAGGRAYYTRTWSDDGSGRKVDLANRATGSQHALVAIKELAPGASGPTTHVHDFDQFYFVMEGRLEVEIGLETHVVGPQTLVILPAGVPHSQRNASADEIERHIVIATPEPMTPHSAESPWDTAVRLTATGEVIA